MEKNKDYVKYETDNAPVERPVTKAKKAYKVIAIRGNKLVLVDGNNCGVQIPLTNEHKKAKIGDVIYL